MNKDYERIHTERSGDFSDDPGAATVGDRSNFRLDDHSAYHLVNINERKEGDEMERTPVWIEVLFCKIGLSRVFSFSGFIDPLVRLKDILAVDQRLELHLVASMLNTTIRFHYVMRMLIGKHLNTEDEFEFGAHPFYDWLRWTRMTYNGEWQGGGYHRYSPFGGIRDIEEYFGSYEEGFEEGRERLKRFVSVLFQSLGWVDSLEGNNEADALPMENLEESFDRICARLRYVMKDVANFQYGTFYLSVFFTIAIGCREVKPGKHLCQLSYPIRTTAAYKHLNNPLGNTWDGTNFVGVHDLETILDRVSLRVCGRKSGDCHATVERAKCSLARKSFDSFMETLSHELAEELGIPVYYRVLIECLLCESMHSRKLHKVECHMKHGNTFDIFIRQGGVDYAGVPMMLEYGESVWKEVPVGTVTGCVFVDMELIKETDIYEK